MATSDSAANVDTVEVQVESDNEREKKEKNDENDQNGENGLRAESVLNDKNMNDILLATHGGDNSNNRSANSSQIRLTRDTTARRLNRYLSAADAAKPMSIEFINMCADVPSHPGSKDKKRILNNVSGVINSGEFVALMGPSGAGKSTLLNVLGLRFEESYSGQVYINGVIRNKDHKRKIGYVLQHDILLPNVSVRETLEFTAKMRLPKKMNEKEKMQRVDDIIHLMGLNSCQNTQVQLCSGGEKKRIAIGNEMLVNPSILFLDEPTSGLDSASAYSILTILKELTKQGRTVIASIHQPDSQSFSKFDKLLLVASGHLVYFGQIEDATNYFGECGYSCPVHYNPADYILELVTDNFVSEDESLQNKDEIKKHLIECWKKEERKNNNKKKNSDKNSNDNNTKLKNDRDIMKEENKWSTNWFEQFYLLLIRAMKHRRGHNLSKIKFVEMTAVAIIAGLIWFQMDKRERNIKDFVGGLFFINIYIQFMTMYRGVVHFPTEKNVIKRERQSGTYRLSTYYASKLVAELPVDMLLPIWSVTIAYWMTGVNNNFGIYFLFILATTLGVGAANAFGTFLGCSINVFDRAMTSLAVVGLFMMLCGGFYIPETEMPLWISWLRYISFMRYIYLIVLQIVLIDNPFQCDNPSAFEKCNDNESSSLNKSDILDYLVIQEPVWQSVTFLMITLIVWHLLAYYFLRRSTSVH